MNDNSNQCAVTEESLLDYFEGSLDATAAARVEEHAARCLPCGALIRDVNAIRADAASLTDVGPSRDLWEGIEARIQSQVVSIGAVRPRRLPSYRWLAAAAALLVVSTSTVTYLATSRSLAERSAALPLTTPPGAAVAATAALTDSAGGQAAPESAGSNSSQPGLRLRSAGTLASSDNSLAAGENNDLPYDGEIRRLQSALVERRTQLDSATVRIVEENLVLIDTAVRQARAALARDPASGFLSGQLNNALEKKIELLRTAAMLPSRT